MSKGLGQIERRILRLLADAPHGLDTVTLTVVVYQVEIPDWYQEHPLRKIYLHDLVSDAQRSAVRRALASLKRQGLVEDLGTKGWAKGRRHWRIAPDILQRLANGAEPGRSLWADSLRDDPLADQLRLLLDLPPPQRARRAAELNAAIARRALRLQWEAEMDAADGATATESSL